MLKIKLLNKTIPAEESWTECTPERVAELSVFCRLQDQTDDAWQEMMIVWLRLSPEKWRTIKLTRTEWDGLKEAAAWIWTAPEGKPFEYIEHQKVRYYLPKENFEDSTAIEVAMGFINYLAYGRAEDPDKAAIDVLISSFCRPERADIEAFKASDKWNGDRRQPYNEARAIERAMEIESLPIGYKIAFLNYFEATLGAFLEQFGEIFGKDGEERYAGGGGMIMLLKNVAKEGTFGTFEAVCQTPANLIFAAKLDDVLDLNREKDESAEN